LGNNLKFAFQIKSPEFCTDKRKNVSHRGRKIWLFENRSVSSISYRGLVWYWYTRISPKVRINRSRKREWSLEKRILNLEMDKIFKDIVIHLNFSYVPLMIFLSSIGANLSLKIFMIKCGSSFFTVCSLSADRILPKQNILYKIPVFSEIEKLYQTLQT